MACIEAKKEIRRHIKFILNTMSSTDVQIASRHCMERVIASSSYQNSKALCCYLQMPGELATDILVSQAFKDKKRVFVPKVVGTRSCDMKFCEVHSYQEIENFEISKWGIPEPSQVETTDDFLRDLDLVIVAGMAFDSSCRRLGRGKGYYGMLQSNESCLHVYYNLCAKYVLICLDYFLSTLQTISLENNSPKACFMVLRLSYYHNILTCCIHTHLYLYLE
jgi:5-formyltetrahydrofolate cyclo-ligase